MTLAGGVPCLNCSSIAHVLIHVLEEHLATGVHTVRVELTVGYSQKPALRTLSVVGETNVALPEGRSAGNVSMSFPILPGSSLLQFCGLLVAVSGPCMLRRR
jgi:hypothetical protein